MSLEYSDENELVYQAKAAAKDIINAKYEVSKKAGDFLFLAHSEEEFYQRASAIDQIIDSTATRRLASVSDSKSKLIKALFQEWEIKHASCDDCGQENFSLPEKVAAPIFPVEKTTQQAGPARSGKLWDKWVFLKKKKDQDGLIRDAPFEKKDERGMPLIKPEQRDTYMSGITDKIIANSLGRLDDPEVYKQALPGSAIWVDPYGLYGPDKKPTFSGLRGRREERGESPEDRKGIVDASKLTAMVGRIHGRRDLGNEGIFLTHHKDTGNSFRGFNGNQTGSFPPAQHKHCNGDGCGLETYTAPDGTVIAPEGSMQPGSGKQHIIATVQTPQIYSQQEHDENGNPTKLSMIPLPYLEKEQPRDLSGVNKSELQRQKNQAKTPAQAEALYYTNPTQEQTGEIPLERAFLLHHEDAEKFANVLDQYHQGNGGTGRHPANLDEFNIGGRTHHVGDIVALRQGEGARHPGAENDLGVVVGASSHPNGQYVRFGRNHGLGPNTDNDSSRVSSKPGEYSLIVHRLNSPISGRLRPTAVDPDTNKLVPNPVNETTQYYPSDNVDTVESFDSKRYSNKKNYPKGPVHGLYSRLKTLQNSFNAKPAPTPSEKPKTVGPSRKNLNVTDLDLNDLLFGNSNEDE
jgi:hypothetical protein